MAFEPNPKTVGNSTLHLIKGLIFELDHLPCIEINEVVMLTSACVFEAAEPLAEIMPLDDADFFEQAECAIHCCSTD